MQKTAIINTDIKALYQAAAKDGQTAFNVATSDALNPPVIKAILRDNYHGIPGDTIIIQQRMILKPRQLLYPFIRRQVNCLNREKQIYNPIPSTGFIPRQERTQYPPAPGLPSPPWICPETARH
jgi:hypothetical protein